MYVLEQLFRTAMKEDPFAYLRPPEESAHVHVDGYLITRMRSKHTWVIMATPTWTELRPCLSSGVLESLSRLEFESPTPVQVSFAACL